MASKTPDQLARADLIDTIRTIVGLESRIARRHRLNELEAELLAEFDERVSNGLPFKPDLSALIKGELE